MNEENKYGLTASKIIDLNVIFTFLQPREQYRFLSSAENKIRKGFLTSLAYEPIKLVFVLEVCQTL